jgi:hypothetical protein
VRGSAASPLGRTEYSIDAGTRWSTLPLLASVDGGKTWRPASDADHALLQSSKGQELRSGAVVASEGGRLLKAAPASLYSHVRWVLKDPLPPGARAALSVKVKVL